MSRAKSSTGPLSSVARALCRGIFNAPLSPRHLFAGLSKVPRRVPLDHVARQPPVIGAAVSCHLDLEAVQHSGSRLCGRRQAVDPAGRELSPDRSSTFGPAHRGLPARLAAEIAPATPLVISNCPMSTLPHENSGRNSRR